MYQTYLSQVPCPNGTLYTIRAGDTLNALAPRFGTTVDAILAANPGINPRNLQIGQVICIPTPSGGFCPGGTAYTIQSGDTFFLLAQRFGLSVQALINANPGVNPNNLFIGQVICVPVPPPPRPLCCATLSLAAEIPPSQLYPGGAALIKPAATATEAVSVTFAVTGLPEPSVFGDFDAFLGQVIIPATAPNIPPNVYAAFLTRIAEEGQPVTWAGTRVVPEEIGSTATLEIRAVNTAVGRGGVTVLRRSGSVCRG